MTTITISDETIEMIRDLREQYYLGQSADQIVRNLLEIRPALEFYANQDNWQDIEDGIECYPGAGVECYPGPALDDGATAREALGLTHE